MKRPDIAVEVRQRAGLPAKVLTHAVCNLSDSEAMKTAAKLNVSDLSWLAGLHRRYAKQLAALARQRRLMDATAYKLMTPGSRIFN